MNTHLRTNQSMAALASESQPIRVGLTPINTPLSANPSTADTLSNPTLRWYPFTALQFLNSMLSQSPAMAGILLCSTDSTWQIQLFLTVASSRFGLYFYFRNYVVLVSSLDSSRASTGIILKTLHRMLGPQVYSLGPKVQLHSGSAPRGASSTAPASRAGLCLLSVLFS